MKYWIGYLVAGIFAAITWALHQFARTHQILMDMIYPYMTRLVITTLSGWNSGSSCLWQTLLVIAVLLCIVYIVLMVIFRWNFFRWLGWVLAGISCVVLLNTGLYELNAYTSPLADDISLSVTDYTVSELNEAAVYFRDKANALATTVSRDSKGDVEFGTFEEMAEQAADGFKTMTYDKAISVFAGSTQPVKKQTLLTSKGDSGITVALTGEAAVNPKVPEISLPFAMCKEMAHRMCIYSDTDANFAAFLAASNNSSENFQYSAYLMAYYYCYETLASIPTSTAKACAEQTNSGVNQLMANDLADCKKFYGNVKDTTNRVNTTDETDSEEETKLITFSNYSSTTDLFASWYIQEYILPVHQEEEVPFNPMDSSQVVLN